MPPPKYAIPRSIIERDGPFDEFKQDGAIVSVELADGTVVSGVLLIYPDQVWAVKDCTDIPFDTQSVRRVYQTPEDLCTRSSSDWVFFGAPGAR